MAKKKTAAGDLPGKQMAKRSAKAWDKSYNAYLRKRKEYQDRGIALQTRRSKKDFKELYTMQKNKKSVIREIVQGDMLISGAQASKISKGLKTARIEKWISENQKLVEAEAEFYGDAKNKGKAYTGPKGLYISEEIKEGLRGLKAANPKQIRSPEFMEKYQKLAPYISEYNRSQKGRNYFTELIYMK